MERCESSVSAVMVSIRIARLKKTFILLYNYAFNGKLGSY